MLGNEPLKIMADIYISKTKVRRGTDQQRRHTRFDQGELINTTDTKRLYVGNGVLSGGISTSTKVHPPVTSVNSLSNIIAEVGDLVYANSIWYQLTANPYSDYQNWGDMRTKVSSEFTYDTYSILNVTLSGLSASKINPNTLTNGVQIKDDKIQLNYNTNFFEISSNQLSLKNGGITTNQILSSSFGNGLSGGNGNLITLEVSSEFAFISSILNMSLSGLSASKINPNTVTNGVQIKDDKIQLNYNTSFFEISSNQFSIKNGGITTREILSSSFGNGLSGGNGNTITLKVDNDFYFDNGVLKTDHTQFHLPLSSFNGLSALSAAKIGDTASVNGSIYQLQSEPPTTLGNWEEITNGVQSSVYDTLTGNSTLNANNSLSAIFNGVPSHSLDGGIPGLTITKFEAISSNSLSSVTITLSSAGFLTFEGDFQTKTGKSVGRFAIPIFSF